MIKALVATQLEHHLHPDQVRKNEFESQGGGIFKVFIQSSRIFYLYENRDAREFNVNYTFLKYQLISLFHITLNYESIKMYHELESSYLYLQ